MENLNDIENMLAKLIGTATNSPLVAIDISSSLSILPNFLAVIDSDCFGQITQPFNNWEEVRNCIEIYIEEKQASGIVRFELDIEGLAIGQPDAIVEFWLQFLLILSSVESEKLSTMLSGLEKSEATSIQQLMRAIGFNNECGLEEEKGELAEFKKIYRLLEQKEKALDAQTIELTQAKTQLEKFKNETSRLNNLLENAQKQILDLRSTREEHELILMENRVDIYDINGDDEIPKRSVSRVARENIALSEIVFECRKSLNDKESELKELQSLRPLLTKKQLELDEMTQQLAHYQSISVSAKLEKEIVESKLRALESIVDNSQRLKETLVTKEHENLTLKRENTELRTRVDDLERLLKNAKDNMNLLSRGSVSSIDNPHNIFYKGNYIKELETENTNLRNKINELRTKLGVDPWNDIENELSSMPEMVKKAMKRSPMAFDRARTYHETRNSVLSPDNLKKTQTTTLAYLEDNLENLIKSKEQSEKELKTKEMRNMNSSITWFNIEELPLKIPPKSQSISESSEKAESKDEHMHILYSALMEYHHFSLMKERKLVSSDAERKRDVLRPFSLNTFLQYSAVI